MRRPDARRPRATLLLQLGARIATIGLTATDSNGLASDEVTATVRVRPVANDATASAVASATPPAVTIPITSTGTAPWTYDIVSGLPSALGTAAFSADGDLVITPAQGVSGTLQLTYSATDADGLRSDAATVTLTVVPLAAHAAITLTSGGRLRSAVSAVPGSPLGDRGGSRPDRLPRPRAGRTGCRAAQR